MKKTIRCVATLFSILTCIQYKGQAQIGPAIKWQKCLGGTGNDGANDVLPTPDGGFLVVGYEGSTNGNITGHHGSPDSSDAWITKLDAFGNIIWQKSMGGTGNDYFNSIIPTNDNNYLCIGRTASFNGDVSGNHGNYDFWLVKINASGGIIWSKCYGGTNSDIAADGVQTTDGGFAIIGNTLSANGDVSGYHGSSGHDIWIIKVNNAGNLLWQKCYGNPNTGAENASDIIEDDQDHHLIASVQPEGIDSEFFAANGYNEFLIKVNKDNGAYIYKNASGRARFSSSGSLAKRKSGYFHSIAGSVEYPACSDPRSQVELVSNSGNVLSTITAGADCVSYDATYSSVFAKAHGIETLDDSSFIGAGIIYDLKGNGPAGIGYGLTDACIGIGRFTTPGTLAVKKYGGSGEDNFMSVKVMISGNDYIAVGITSSNNIDVSGNHGKQDCWIVRLVGANSITGNVFVDNNGNGTKDNGEANFDKVIVRSEKAGFTQNGIPYGGFYRNDIDTGTYTTSVLLNRPYYTIIPSSKTSVFTTYKNTDTVNFALRPIAGKKDYGISASSLWPVRPGYHLYYEVVYSNKGTDTMVNKKVIFIKDRHTQYHSAIPAVTAISGDTLSWNISNLLPAGSGTIGVILKLDSIPKISINDTLSAKFYIDSTGDVFSSDNIAVLRNIVRGGYDPNDKQENYNGAIARQDVVSNKSLTYTIRFQNTGNDTAFNIVIRDTLDAKLDWNSIEMITASHPYQLNIKDGRYCTWQFSNIKLVDSIHNETLSHGYIVYGIKPKSTLAIGDTIRNSASIYFDFNPAVKTNTQVTVVKSNPPPMPVVTGLPSTYCSNQGVQKGKISNLPASGSGIAVIVRLDGAVLPVAADSTFSFDAGLITAGTHQVKVVFANSAGSDSLSYNFAITVPVTPDVNISANITNVSNLTDPVVITATNAAGGGSAPKYTFAKDKAFSNILQAESNSNTITVQPNTLTVGNNWMYASMKTSEACYTRQADMDSINIIRNPISGLTDVDLPGQLISVYPNPFRQSINISGLNTGKTYVVEISNSVGQKVHSQQVANASKLTIHKAGLQSGAYRLSIYDYKKQRLIGTVSMVKE